MRRFLMALISVAALLMAASPAAASTPATGTRINLFAPPATFEAGAPFYVEHGSACDPSVGDSPSDCMSSDTHFDLYVDGTLQASTIVVENSPNLYVKLNLANFAAGLAAGRHSFVGVWIQGGSVYLTLSARINFR